MLFILLLILLYIFKRKPMWLFIVAMILLPVGIVTKEWGVSLPPSGEIVHPGRALLQLTEIAAPLVLLIVVIKHLWKRLKENERGTRTRESLTARQEVEHALSDSLTQRDQGAIVRAIDAALRLYGHWPEQHPPEIVRRLTSSDDSLEVNALVTALEMRLDSLFYRDLLCQIVSNKGALIDADVLTRLQSCKDLEYWYDPHADGHCSSSDANSNCYCDPAGYRTDSRKMVREAASSALGKEVTKR